MLIPLIGNDDTCNGDMTVVIDTSAPVPLTGWFDCDWPIFGLWAQITVGPINDGLLTGNWPGGSSLSGTISGSSSMGTFVFTQPWSGTLGVNTIDGSFSDHVFLVEDYQGIFSLTKQP